MSRKVIIRKPDLTSYQIAILYCHARFTITEASTKSGKTYSHLWWLTEQWHRKDVDITWECWWVAPIYDQARIAYARLKSNLRKAPGYAFNDTKLTITNPDGRVMRFKTADDPDALYGENVLAWVFDEFSRGKPQAFTALRSTLTYTGGKGKLIGNFIGNANWGHQLAEKHQHDPEWAYFKITAMQAVEAGILPVGEVEQARLDLPHSDFMALYMAEGSAHPLQLMRADAINDLWTNTHAQEGAGYLVADIARLGRDTTVVGIWSGFVLKELIQWANKDIPEAQRNNPLPWVSASIANLAKLYSVPRSHIVVDEGGVGGGVVDLLPGCMSFNGADKAIEQRGKAQNFANLRAQGYFTLADHVNEALLYLAPECDGFRDRIAIELEVVRRLEDQAEGKLRIIKKEDIKELIGRSPDFADMLMMRMLPELRGTDLMNASLYRRAEKHRVEIRKEGLRRSLKPRPDDGWR